MYEHDVCATRARASANLDENVGTYKRNARIALTLTHFICFRLHFYVWQRIIVECVANE